MAEDVVLYEVVDRVALVTFNRPERLNALIPGMATAYYDCLAEGTVADQEVGAIVVTGAGRGFCAGADMGYLPQAGTVEAGRTARPGTACSPCRCPS